MLDKTKINLLIVHCSDTPDDKDLRALDIHEMHLSFGWDGIGYHKVICRNGNIENGRPEFWIGAHTFNKNERSLGVCLIGRNNFSDLQFLSLKNLLIEWKIKYANSTIIGHRDAINKKTCPNCNIEK